jgi:hypothetical protein
MRNVAPSRSLGRRTRQLILFGFLSVSGGVFLLSIGVLLYLILFAAVDTTGAQIQRISAILLLILGGGLVLAGIFFLLRSVVRRRENDLANLTGEYLSQFLDERYQFIRNINRPVLGYIDAVLVGPPGILVFRILNQDGDFINDGENWVRRNRGGDYMPWRVNPTREAEVDVRAVQNFLVPNNIEREDVFGIVVFIESEPHVTFQLKDPQVPVTHLATLLETLKEDYLTRERLAPRLAERATRRLLGDL